MFSRNLISFGGIFLLLGIAWILSSNRRKMNWNLIGWGLGLQMFAALVIFVVPAGSKFFMFLNEVVVQILNSAMAGAQFVFGRLALPPGQSSASGETSLGFILAFQGFPTIIFFSALISILYFLNIMPLIIRGFSFVFTKLMKISGAESLVAASNIFVGIESALTVKPHLDKMTRSEFCTVLSVGMATVASNVLAFYVFCLRDQFPSIAGHLVSASLLSAPAALVMSKILLPEEASPETLGVHVHPHYVRDQSLFDAIINGANAGVKMIVGIVALLIAVVGLVSLTDLCLGLIGAKINALLGMDFSWTLKNILGILFYPLTLIIGISPVDASAAAQIIGERLVVTEVVAYQDLALALQNGSFVDPRTKILVAYALCGFAHVASMAIFVGGTSALAPARTPVITSVALRALAAATLACLLTACVAGTFLTGQTLLF